ncbi:unnamed protein product [Urochloa humidicola]
MGDAAVAEFAARTGAAALATPTATSTLAIPDDDILSVHDAMEFHVGGRNWLDPDLVPKKRKERIHQAPLPPSHSSDQSLLLQRRH